MWQSLILREKVSKLITSFQIPEKVQVYASLQFHFKVLIPFPFIMLTWLHLDRPHLLRTGSCQTFHFPSSTSSLAPAKGPAQDQGAWPQAFGSGHQPLAAKPFPRGNRATSQTKLQCWQLCLRGPYTCFLSPPLGEFLHNLPNFDTKPKAVRENADKFYYIKKNPKLLCGAYTGHKIMTHLGKLQP